MRYYIGFRDGINPAGNDGMMRCTWKVEYFIQKHAHMFGMSRKLDEVFIIDNYSQEMCEMNGGMFREYVRKHGRKVWDKNSHLLYLEEAHNRLVEVENRRIYQKVI